MKGVRVHDCTACEGMGVDHCPETGAEIACEGCEGCGKLVDCANCLEPMPYDDAANNGAFCVSCRDSLDVGDQEAERARLRRSA